MSYTALYRRLRPSNFDEIVGQTAIVQTIKNQIISDRISHAYLFTGTRGCGKTSTARILAKAINCENNVDGNPCEKCKSCIDISKDKSINIIEIDAASNNGVDNIRQINDEVRYTPTIGKYKVYIIDEVHMLSGGAFNALLKTLEEPPSHVKFILATTEPHKIPATILSRCQRYDFKRISTEDIFSAIKSYCNSQNFDVEDDALFYIARTANGAMRDALSLLDQVLALFSNEKLTLVKVLDLLGGANNDDILQLAKSILNSDVYESLNWIDKAFKNGLDLNIFTGNLIEAFRNILIAKVDENATSAIEMTVENIAKVKSIAASTATEVLTYVITELSYLQRDMKLSLNTRTMLEVGIVKICKFRGSDDLSSLEAKIASIEKKLHSGQFRVNVPSEKTENTPNKKQEKSDRVLIKSAPKDVLNAIKHFEEMADELDKTSKHFLRSCKPLSFGDSNMYIYCYADVVKNHLQKEEVTTLIKNILKSRFNKDFNLKIIGADEYNKITGSNFDRDKTNESADDIYEQLKELINFEITLPNG